VFYWVLQLLLSFCFCVYYFTSLFLLLHIFVWHLLLGERLSHLPVISQLSFCRSLVSLICELFHIICISYFMLFVFASNFEIITVRLRYFIASVHNIIFLRHRVDMYVGAPWLLLFCYFYRFPTVIFRIINILMTRYIWLTKYLDFAMLLYRGTIFFRDTSTPKMSVMFAHVHWLVLVSFAYTDSSLSFMRSNTFIYRQLHNC